jgi:disulfide bond formation protein DsbB
MFKRMTVRQANLVAFLACVSMMAFALYQQYGLGHEPCHLCILQRIAVIGLGLLFGLAAVQRPGELGARVYGALQLLAAGFGMGAAGRNVWVQLQPEGAVPACGAPLNVLLKVMPLRDALMKVFWSGGECHDVVWSLFGVSLAGWVLLAVFVLGVWAAYWNLARRIYNRRTFKPAD